MLKDEMTTYILGENIFKPRTLKRISTGIYKNSKLDNNNSIERIKYLQIN